MGSVLTHKKLTLFQGGHVLNLINTWSPSSVWRTTTKDLYTDIPNVLHRWGIFLSKDVPFTWGEEQEKSFQDLKQALILPPILRFPDSSRPFHLQTDASLDGISYILGQTDDEGRKYVISYGGRGLRPCEKKWPITQLECLSLLTGIREFHVYLAAAPFVVYTDHISLKYLESLKVSAYNRLARWSLALQPYKFTVEHVSGTKLTAADGQRRLMKRHGIWKLTTNYRRIVSSHR